MSTLIERPKMMWYHQSLKKLVLHLSAKLKWRKVQRTWDCSAVGLNTRQEEELLLVIRLHNTLLQDCCFPFYRKALKLEGKQLKVASIVQSLKLTRFTRPSLLPRINSKSWESPSDQRPLSHKSDSRRRKAAKTTLRPDQLHGGIRNLPSCLEEIWTSHLESILSHLLGCLQAVPRAPGYPALVSCHLCWGMAGSWWYSCLNHFCSSK